MKLTRLAGKKSLTLLDQAVSSITNFAAGVFAASSLSTDEFGAYAILTFGYILLLGATRAAMSDVAIVNRQTRSAGVSVDLGAADGVAVTTFLSLGVFAIAVTAANVPIIQAGLAGLAIGVMVVQDSMRIISIARDRPADALANDLVWLLGLAVTLPVVVGLELPLTGFTAMAAWGLSAVPALMYGSRRNHWIPRLNRGLLFIRSHKRLSSAFLGDWALKQGSSQVATYGIGLLGGVAAVAGIRAGLLLLGPLNVAFTGLQLAATPAAVSLRETDLRAMQRLLYSVSGALAIIALSMGLILVSLPTQWLELVVGRQASGLKEYVLPLSVTLMSSGLMVASHIGMRVLREGGRLIATRVATTVIYLAAGVAGYLITGSVSGGLWGLGGGTLLGVAIWELAFRRVLREVGPEVAQATSTRQSRGR